MILSKGQLSLSSVGDVVDVHADGSASVAKEGIGVVAVGPVAKEVQAEAVVEDSGPMSGSIPSKGLGAVKVPADKLFGGRLEMVDVKEEGDLVEVRVRDETRREDVSRIVTTKRGHAMGTRGALRRGLKAEEDGARCVVNRKWLMGALKALDRACPDPEGRAPVWLSIGDDGTLVLRGVNMRTDQRALAVGQAYEVTRDEWLEDSPWEEGLRARKGRKRPT